MGHVANAIGWLTVAIAASIVSLQVAYLPSVDSIPKQPLASNMPPLIDVVAPGSERAAACDSFRIAYH
jgi:hypothetical protein